jgi:predicted DNA binding CopG/RHH family protein
MKPKINLKDFEVDESIKLSDDEPDLLKGIKGSKSIFTEELSHYYSQVAINNKKRTKQLSMRLTDEDFLLAKTKGLEEGLPYQVLLASVVHKWLHGKYKEVA